MPEEFDIAIPLQWVGDLVSPPSPVNQIVVSMDAPAQGAIADLHLLTFGFVVPPTITDGMSREQIAAIVEQPLPIVPVGRFTVTTSRLREFRDIISAHLSRLESAE